MLVRDFCETRETTKRCIGCASDICEFHSHPFQAFFHLNPFFSHALHDKSCQGSYFVMSLPLRSAIRALHVCMCAAHDCIWSRPRAPGIPSRIATSTPIPSPQRKMCTGRRRPSTFPRPKHPGKRGVGPCACIKATIV